MRIVFCTNYNGQTGVTSNLAATASYLAMQEHQKTYLMQAQFGKNYLDQALLGEQMAESQGQENGIDGLIRMIKSEPVTKEMLDSCSVNLYQNQLFLLPGSGESEASMYEDVVQPMLVYCMNAANLHYDLVLIDAGKCDWRKKQPLLEHADVIVVNLNQNAFLVQHCFEGETEYKKKLFFLIGRYDPISKYNLNYLHHKYHIPLSRMAVIPYNTMFQDAFSDGQLLKFFTQIALSTKDEMNYYFNQEVLATVKKMLVFGEKQESSRSQRKKVKKTI